MKDWFLNVGLQKFGPSLVRAALAGFTGILLAHAGALQKFGIIYDATSNTLSLHLSTLQEWLDVTGLGVVAGIFAIAQHHTVAAITGAPQSGAPAQGGTSSSAS